MRGLNENLYSKNFDFDTMYRESWYTISGTGGDLEDWINGYQEILDSEDIGKIKKWVTFTGKDMNDFYNLTGKTKYPNNFQFLAFPLKGLNMGKLAMLKMKMKDRWFDDIVDNNNRIANSYEENEDY